MLHTFHTHTHTHTGKISREQMHHALVMWGIDLEDLAAFPPPSCPSDTVEKEEFVAFACHELQRMKIAANPDSVDALAEGVEKAVL